jgi:hypothetical protein
MLKCWSDKQPTAKPNEQLYLLNQGTIKWNKEHVQRKNIESPIEGENNIGIIRTVTYFTCTEKMHVGLNIHTDSRNHF